MKKYQKLLWRLKREDGGVAVYVAIALVVFLTFLALVIDVGHVAVVRNELQNAADASALAGAGNLYPGTGSPPTTPNWTRAESYAISAVRFNRSDGTSLADCDAQSGYWNVTNSSTGLQAKTLTPLSTNDLAAVRASVRRAEGDNGGSMATFFGSFLGISTVDVSAVAVAVAEIISPSAFGPEVLMLPIAISKAMADRLKNGEYNTSSKTFKIDSAWHPAGDPSLAAQWTTFKVESNSADYVRGLMENGNPDTLGVGDNIYIVPGMKRTEYDSVPVNFDVVLPVVDAVLRDGVKSFVPVTGFIGFHVTAVQKSGKDPYVEGYFLDSFTVGRGVPGNAGSGNSYGVNSYQLRLVQ